MAFRHPSEPRELRILFLKTNHTGRPLRSRALLSHYVCIYFFFFCCHRYEGGFELQAPM